MASIAPIFIGTRVMPPTIAFMGRKPISRQGSPLILKHLPGETTNRLLREGGVSSVWRVIRAIIYGVTGWLVCVGKVEARRTLVCDQAMRRCRSKMEKDGVSERATVCDSIDAMFSYTI